MNEFEKAAVAARSEVMKVIKEMRAGTRETGIEWADDLLANKVTLKEMIGTDDGSRDFIEKVTYDLYQGRENVPLLYKGIYTTLEDANFPKSMTAEEFGPVQIVFLEKYEGGEVKFGQIGAGVTKIVTFATYAAGIEYNEDMIEYNQTWRISEIGIAFGEAYNKLLNHMHLYPFIAASYATTGGGLTAQKSAQEDATAQLIAWDTSLAKTLRNAVSVLPRGTMMLINSSDRYALEDAIYGSLYADNKTPSVVRRKLDPASFVEYDGDSVEVGGKTYTYTGVTAGYAYLIAPKQNFKEYIKHDLRVDSDNGDLSRLIVSQIVGRARRAVLAGMSGKYGAIKIDIAA